MSSKSKPAVSAGPSSENASTREGRDQGGITDVALLIDWENLKINLGKVGLSPNVGALYEAARDYGRVVVAQAYMDWFEHGMETDPHSLYRAGVEPIYVPKRRTPTKVGKSDDEPVIKNSVDVRMAVEAATLCHTNPNIGTFVLVSGDQDFLHAVNALRPFGRRVVVIGVTGSISQRLVEFVDQVVYYDRDIDGTKSVVHSSQTTKDTPSLEDVLNAVREVLKASPTPGIGLFSHIGTELRNRYPTYHPRAHGFSNFRQLMDRAKEMGIIAGYEARGLQYWAYLKGSEKGLQELLRDTE